MPITPNALQQWIDFYKSQMPRPGSSMGDSFGGGQDWNAQPNYDGGALAFAQRMAGQQGTPQPQQMPDYFANVPSGNPQGGPQGQVGLGAGGMSPQQGYNRLAMMLKRGGG